MSTSGGVGSVAAAAAAGAVLTVVLPNGDAADDTVDSGVGGPDLEHTAGDMG